MIDIEKGVLKTARIPVKSRASAAFDYEAVLYMGTDLAEMARTEFYLDAAEEKEISLEVAMPDVPGRYPVHVGLYSPPGGDNIGLYRSADDVNIIEPVVGDPIVFYSNLRVIPARVSVGESVEIRVDATNMGATHASLTLNLGPDTGLTADVSLESGETKRYTWNYTAPSAGHYEVHAGDLTVLFEVTPYEDPWQPPLDPDQTAMAGHIPSGIIWTFRHTGPGAFEFGCLPEQAHYIKHSGNHYRYADNSNVIDYWVDTQGLHRYQLQGTHIAFPKHHIWEPGNMYWYWMQAFFNYMDDGLPNGWYSQGVWSDMWSLCVFSGSTSWMCGYFPKAG